MDIIVKTYNKEEKMEFVKSFVIKVYFAFNIDRMVL